MNSRHKPAVAAPPTMLSVLAALVFAAITSSCAVGPNYHAPAAPDVTRYGATAAQTTAAAAVPGGAAQRLHPGADVPGRWWTAFQSRQIDTLVQQALDANPDLQAAQAALDAAMQISAAQRGAYFPQVALGAASSREQDARILSPTLSNGAERFSLNTAQVSVNYPIDLFGANRRQVEALVAGADAQRFQMEATYLTLVSNTIAAAIAQASAVSQLHLAAQIVRSEQDSLQILRRQYQLGAVSMAQLQTQEAALAQAQAAVPALEQQRTQQHDLLAALTGRVPSQMPLQQFDLSALTLPQDLPLSLPSKLVEQRPDVRIAAAELHAATAQVGVATADMLPNIALSANAGSAVESLAHLLGPGTGFWSLGGALSQTLFAGGSLEHRRKAAVATMDQAAAQYRSTVLQAFRQVADVLAALQSDAAILQAQARASAAASQSLATTQHDVQVGAASYLDLLDAQRSYNQAVIAQAAARAARLTDTVALFQALGGGWWSADAPPLPGSPAHQAQQAHPARSPG